ncbi:flagellar assembly protein FliH [Ferrimonas marina]|nr:flagellar assembly protein FliH [Ferrimonas marina]
MAQDKRWRLDGSRARLYRFTPLPQEGLATESGEGDNWQGYQEGFDKGYQEGLQQGHEAGFADGQRQGEESGHQQGFANGRQEGLEAGQGQAREELQSAIVPLAAMKELLEEGYQSQVRQQQELILELVQRVAQQVIRCELTLQPQQVLNLVEETLQALPDGQDDLKIHLEPSACERIRELAPERAKQWTLVPDPSISPGGCRVVSDNLDADASVESRLDACMEQVRKRLDSMESDGEQR